MVNKRIKLNKIIEFDLKTLPEFLKNIELHTTGS